MCSFSVGVYAYSKAPVSYLSLDINPIVELGINAFVEDTLSTLVTSAAEEGFIADENNTETLTVPSKKENKTSIKVKTYSYKNTDKSNKKGKNY